jgi:hypothetical protein
MSLSLEEWTLLSHCEQPVTLRTLCEVSTIADFDLCRFLWAMVTLGIVMKESGSD